MKQLWRVAQEFMKKGLWRRVYEEGPAFARPPAFVVTLCGKRLKQAPLPKEPGTSSLDTWGLVLTSPPSSCLIWNKLSDPLGGFRCCQWRGWGSWSSQFGKSMNLQPLLIGPYESRGESLLPRMFLKLSKTHVWFFFSPDFAIPLDVVSYHCQSVTFENMTVQNTTNYCKWSVVPWPLHLLLPVFERELQHFLTLWPYLLFLWTFFFPNCTWAWELGLIRHLHLVLTHTLRLVEIDTCSLNSI